MKDTISTRLSVSDGTELHIICNSDSPLQKNAEGHESKWHAIMTPR